MTDPIVAIGFLTAADLERLGNGFSRAFPVRHDPSFDDLLSKLDEIEVAPAQRGIIIQHGGGEA